MKHEMDQANLDGPDFIDGFFFKVILREPNGKLILPKNIGKTVKFNGYKLNERQILAIEEMNNEHLCFSYNIYSEKFNVSVSTSKRDLKDLIYKKKIKNTIWHYLK